MSEDNVTSTVDQQQSGECSTTAQTEQAELTDEELASLLASTENAAEGGAQIVDSDGNVITVTAEQLESAGIDIDNMGELSEEQLATLMNLASDEGQTGNNESASGSKPEPSSTSDAPPQLEDQSDSAQSGGDLTMVIGDDGSLKLVDASNRQFVLSPPQLQQHGIDVNNLTEDNIHTIVQLAMPNLNQEKSGPTSKRMKLDDSAATSTDISSFVGDDSMRLMDDNSAIDHPGPQSLRRPNRQSGSSTFSLIGQEVEVKKAGRTCPATIRYCRQGAGYKVQFEDGHFEWVSEDQIQLKSTGGRNNRNDHASYTEGEDELPSTSSQKQNAVNGLGASGIGRRVPPAIPGIKVTPQNKDENDPNFCCPICDKKVYQKEPAYIVIRLPACDVCADSKILVLDQDEEGDK